VLDETQTGFSRDYGRIPYVGYDDADTRTFVGGGERFSDGETGSSWLITGEAVSGPLAGTTLDRLPHLDTFWFAWATYRPDTILVTDVPDEN